MKEKKWVLKDSRARKWLVATARKSIIRSFTDLYRVILIVKRSQKTVEVRTPGACAHARRKFIQIKYNINKFCEIFFIETFVLPVDLNISQKMIGKHEKWPHSSEHLPRKKEWRREASGQHRTVSLDLGKGSTNPTSKILHVLRSLCIAFLKVRKPQPTPPSKLNLSEKRRKTELIHRILSLERVLRTKRCRKIKRFFVYLYGYPGRHLSTEALRAMSIQLWTS